MTIAIGGTFSPLHKGHKKLLEVAFGLGEVCIGLTSDDLARKERRRFVLPYSVREENIRQYVKKRFDRNVRIVKLDEPFGPVSHEEEFNYLVVSPETYPVARKINEFRTRNNLKEVKVIEVKHVLAENGEFISSTRIKMGEIDKYGNQMDPTGFEPVASASRRRHSSN